MGRNRTDGRAARHVAALLLLATGVAFGCSCAQPTPEPCQAAWQSTTIFTGTVDRVTLKGSPGDWTPVEVQLTVNQPLRGMEGLGKEVTIRTGRGGGDCGYRFEVGRAYIVYSDKRDDGLLAASICSRTRPVADATADLDYFRGLPAASPLAEITGVVFDPNEFGPDREFPARRGAQVTLKGTGVEKSTLSNAAGKFRFPNLAPGRYRITASAPGTENRYPPPPVEVHAKGCAQLKVSLITDRRIRGRVFDELGGPVEGVLVQVLSRQPIYPGQLPMVDHEAKTAADGRFEINSLREGDYYVGVNLVRTPSPESPYSRYFHAGTDDPQNAKLVHLDEGAGFADNVDLHLPKRQRQKAVDGVVVWPDGRLAAGVNIFVEDPRWPWQTNMVAGTTDAQGRFRVTVFDGTKYRIHAVTASRFTGQAISAEPLAIEGGTVTDPVRLVLTRKGHSAAELSGKGLERWRRGEGL